MNQPKSATSRREFLKSTLSLPVALAAGSAIPMAASTAAEPAAGQPILPLRQLGKTGPKVTMLNMGGMMAAMSPDYLDIAWSMGIRYFDNADCYIGGKSETVIAQWLAKYPQRRKEVFLTSKDHPRKGPEQLLEMIDRRLERIGAKYLDLFFIHGIGPKSYGDESFDWPKGDEFRRVADKLKSSGKCKMVGFTCHDPQLVKYLEAAAAGEFVDAIMMSYTPFFKPGDSFDRALDACYNKGIGLIAMKTMRHAGDVPKRIPDFEKHGLTTRQALLHAVWSDSRISSICSMLENVGQIEENTTAARTYKKPLKAAEIEVLRQTVLAHRRSLCPGCSTCNAAAARTDFAFHAIARYVSYYEQDGNLEARDYYRALPATARDETNIDLAALRDRCEFKVDYPDIINRAHRYFS